MIAGFALFARPLPRIFGLASVGAALFLLAFAPADAAGGIPGDDPQLFESVREADLTVATLFASFLEIESGWSAGSG